MSVQASVATRLGIGQREVVVGAEERLEPVLLTGVGEREPVVPGGALLALDHQCDAHLVRGLGERPEVALGIVRRRSGGRRTPGSSALDDLGARRPACSLEVRIDVVDVDVHERRVRGPPLLGLCVVPGPGEPSITGSSPSRSSACWIPPSPPIRKLLLEAERLREEVDRRRAVLVEQVGRDPSHAATLPRCG